MEITWIAARLTALLTWAAFAVCMRCYFRRARESSPAKDRLVLLAWLCTLAQLAVFAFGRPPILSLMIAGLVCFGLGHLLYWWALASHGKARPDFAGLSSAPTTLTASGPYRVIRHPIYAAYLVCWLAGALATGQALLLVSLGVMGVLYYRAAREEETSFLAGSLAGPYRDYQSRTGMFLPRLRRAA